MTPLVAARGEGAEIIDVDGRRYIDYCLSWGPLIAGHCHPQVVAACQAQIARGLSFGAATELEMELGEKVRAFLPWVEKMRFVSSGTEATMTALRIARGATGRKKILKFIGHYHGHHDSLLVQAGSGAFFLNPVATSLGVNPGALQDTLLFPFNDREPLEAFFETPAAADLAAIILEPVAGNMGLVPPSPGFLSFLQESARHIGALLIFDEVMCGFRVDRGGAAGLYQIVPDLVCLGKVVGGGLPCAVVGGRRDLLDALAPLGQIYQAGTLSGNPVAMQAGLATLALVEEPSFYPLLFAKTKRLAASIRGALHEKGLPGSVPYLGSMLSLFFGLDRVSSHAEARQADGPLFKRLFCNLFERGIYLPPSHQESWFLSSAHTESQIDQTAEAIRSFIRNI